MRSEPEQKAIVDFVFEHAAATPDRLAIASEYDAFTYGELKRRVLAVADRLTAIGIGRGDIVAVLAPPRTDAYILFLAINSVGAIWLSLNNKFRLPEMQHMVTNARPKAMFFIAEMGGRNYVGDVGQLAESTDSIQHLCSLDRRVDDSELAAVGYFPDMVDFGMAGECAEPGPRDETAVAAIIYTSGSTGRPKGCMLPNRSMVQRVLLQIDEYPLERPPSIYVPFPLNHVGGLVLMAGFAMASGGTAHFRELFVPGDAGAIIEKHGINFLALLPTMYQMIFDADGFDAGRFREVEIFFWSGARMPKSMIQQLQAMGRGQVRTNYGATELCSSLTCSDPDLDIDTLAITIGRSRSGELRVVKQDGNACEAGEIGEIQARREFCMAGYLNNPEATAAAYTEDGWLKTGDLVQVLPDGNLSFVGRDSDMYKSGGENVYPAEIEECIEANPKVNLVAVIGVADELYGEVGRAYIKKDPGADLSAPEIKAWCAERLANFKIPKKFDIRDELPLLANGKIDKVTLRKGID